jgi:hypothetical protein
VVASVGAAVDHAPLDDLRAVVALLQQQVKQLTGENQALQRRGNEQGEEIADLKKKCKELEKEQESHAQKVGEDERALIAGIEELHATMEAQKEDLQALRKKDKERAEALVSQAQQIEELRKNMAGLESGGAAAVPKGKAGKVEAKESPSSSIRRRQTFIPPMTAIGKQMSAPGPVEPGQPRELDFPPLKGKRRRGIIRFLGRNGNVHNRGIVTVSSSGAFSDEPMYAPKNVADLKTDSFFGSVYRKKTEDIPEDEKNNWICYDFMEKKVRPTHYSIRSKAGGGSGWASLKNWVVEVSDNGNNWIEIDCQTNNSKLYGKGAIGVFQASRQDVTGRYVRLVNIGRNHRHDDCLTLSAFEIFGTLVLPAGA